MKKTTKSASILGSQSNSILPLPWPFSAEEVGIKIFDFSFLFPMQIHFHFHSFSVKFEIFFHLPHRPPHYWITLFKLQLILTSFSWISHGIVSLLLPIIIFLRRDKNCFKFHYSVTIILDSTEMREHGHDYIFIHTSFLQISSFRMKIRRICGTWNPTRPANYFDWKSIPG